MQLRIFVEPQFGATYADQLAMAQAAEAHGFDAFFRSDHFLTMGGDGLPGPTDSWVTLGAIARETQRIRLGTLMTSATFRHPGPPRDVGRPGRRDERRPRRARLRRGLVRPSTRPTASRSRGDRRALRPLRGAARRSSPGCGATPAGERYSFSGEHYELADSPALPKPSQQPPPVIIGGMGAKRTPRARRHVRGRVQRAVRRRRGGRGASTSACARRVRRRGATRTTIDHVARDHRLLRGRRGHGPRPRRGARRPGPDARRRPPSARPSRSPSACASTARPARPAATSSCSTCATSSTSHGSPRPWHRWSHSPGRWPSSTTGSSVTARRLATVLRVLLGDVHAAARTAGRSPGRVQGRLTRAPSSSSDHRRGMNRHPPGNTRANQRSREEEQMLLILAVILLIIAIAGGVIIHPLLFALAILALVLFFTGGRRGAAL